MSRAPRVIHSWKKNEIQYIRDTCGKYSLEELAAHFKVSTGSVRCVILNHLTREQSLAIRSKGRQLNIEKSDIKCPYFKKRLSNGIRCDEFAIYIPSKKISKHCREHCIRYYQDEAVHCTMREMLNYKWGMKV